jgi:hypothetical protein
MLSKTNREYRFLNIFQKIKLKTARGGVYYLQITKITHRHLFHSKNIFPLLFLTSK